MKPINALTISLFAFLVACGEGEKDLEAKKAELQALRAQSLQLKEQINALETEIREIDPEFNQSNTVLVSTMGLAKKPFDHKVEIRGSVASRKNVFVSAETMGRIEKIHIDEGNLVRKGDLLLKLDADILENNISEVETQLELADAIFVRQKSLWDKNIGTEIQYLQAKNNKESLERRLATLRSQLSQAYVRAPFSGVADNIPVKEGEMAQPGMPLVRIVNQKEMYISADVSEAFLGKFTKGDVAEIYFPSQDANLTSTITSVGKVINQENRTFTVEVSIPKSTDFEFQPNQVAILNLTDYFREETISVPTKLIQSDDRGKFVYGLDSSEGKKVAKKLRVEPGKSFNSLTEILSGLNGSEILISDGYRDVNEGSEVSITTASL